MILTEVAQSYSHGEVGYKFKILKQRQAGNAPEVIVYADKAKERLHRRYYKMVLGKRKNSYIVKIAISRELACFMWGMVTGNYA